MKNSADLGGFYRPRPSALVDNILLEMQNSLYPTQPHSVIAKYTGSYKIAHVKVTENDYHNFFSHLFFHLSLFYLFSCFYYQWSYFFIFVFLYTGQVTPLNFSARTFLIVALSLSSSSSCFRNSVLLFINSSSCWNNSCSFCFLAARARIDATLFFNLRTVRLSRTSAMLFLLVLSNFTLFEGEPVRSEEHGPFLFFSRSLLFLLLFCLAGDFTELSDKLATLSLLLYASSTLGVHKLSASPSKCEREKRSSKSTVAVDKLFLRRGLSSDGVTNRTLAYEEDCINSFVKRVEASVDLFRCAWLQSRVHLM